ncbi:serine/threonine protein kinase [Chitinimonas lacunae]|uniref:Stress response kinase A n=1 Tax=Chitinimonas lacunae TaxID=1963018 RepID=A0ABV8MUI8_9NEIS
MAAWHNDRMTSAPYAHLSPDVVLDAVEALGLRCDGRLLPLNSYENRVFQVGLDEAAPVVVKFYRPGRWSDAAILEEHAFSAELAEREIPAVPPLCLGGATLHRHADFRYAVFARRGGRLPELDDPEVLEWLGRFLGRLHAVGATRPFSARLRIDIETLGEASLAYLLEHSLPPHLTATYADVARRALDAVRQGFDGDWTTIRLHGDCHGGNLLWTDAGPHFVDFDDACSGPAIQDLWMLLSGERADMTYQLDALLSGYRDFHRFDRAELRLIEPLRTLRLLHYSAWLARRWNDPAFPAAFPWFGSDAYWQEQIAGLERQLHRLAEPPLALYP